MVERRNIHDDPPPHTRCHAPAECNCECRECKRVWEGLGRPGPNSAIPRRIQLEHMTPAERSIYDAVQVVEAAGCDVRLTEAVILLQKARDKVADFVDGVEHPRLARARIKGPARRAP